MANTPSPRRLYPLRAAALAACAGPAAAQTITFAPALAAGAATAVPVDNPLALLPAAAVVLGLGLWALRAKARPAVLRALALAGAGAVLAASVNYQREAWAQVAPPPIVVPTLLGPQNQPIAVIPVNGGQWGFVPNSGFFPQTVQNQSGGPVRITGITPPTAVTTCFPGGLVPQLPGPGPNGPCGVNAVIPNGGSCVVNVNQVCSASVNAGAPLAIGLAVSPASVTLTAGGPVVPITITNTGATRVNGIHFSTPTSTPYSFTVLGLCDSLAAGSSCQLGLQPGPAAHATESVAIGAATAYAVYVDVTTQ